MQALILTVNCIRLIIKVMFCLHNSAPYDQAGYWHRTSAIFSSLTPAGMELSAVTRPGYPWDLIKHRQEPRILQ